MSVSSNWHLTHVLCICFIIFRPKVRVFTRQRWLYAYVRQELLWRKWHCGSSGLIISLCFTWAYIKFTQVFLSPWVMFPASKKKKKLFCSQTCFLFQLKFLISVQVYSSFHLISPLFNRRLEHFYYEIGDSFSIKLEIILKLLNIVIIFKTYDITLLLTFFVSDIEAISLTSSQWSRDAMFLVRYPLVPALLLPRNTRVWRMSAWLSTETVLPTKARCLKPSTWRSSGTSRSFLFVKTISLEWEHLPKGRQPLQSITREGTTFQASGYT